ncbi:MAG: N-acetyltransferase [Deltaproteobacteria bacterium]|nr:N-acetyltransferase [Deltaproteobacteria bacterium]
MNEEFHSSSFGIQDQNQLDLYQGTFPFFAHPTATIDNPKCIGARTKIWHYCHIMDDSEIGEDCVVGQNTFVGSFAKIGNRVKIQNNVSVYAGVILEDEVFCGPSIVFTNDLNPRSHVIKRDFKKTLVKKGATLGANCTIICDTTIGEHAFIGAGSVITKDVLPYALVYGNPARQVGWMCRCGIKVPSPRNSSFCQTCGMNFNLLPNINLNL